MAVSYRSIIQAKCLECSNDQPMEVKYCTVKTCPIYPVRLQCLKGAYRRRSPVSEQEKIRLRGLLQYRPQINDLD